MNNEELAKRLMATFLGELDEHVRTFNRDLLALEKEPAPNERAELFKSLFRTAHSLKGAARSVNVDVIEAASHRLEEILAAARDGVLPLDPDLFQLFFTAADAIADAGRRLRADADIAAAPLASLLPRLGARAAGVGDRSIPHAPPVQAPTGVAAGPEAASPEGTLIRIDASKVDRLLAQSGELLVARSRGTARVAAVDPLREFVRRKQSEWRAAYAPLRRELRGRPVHALPRRAAAALKQNGETLERIARDLDLLTAGLSRDHHLLEQAAAAIEEQVRRMRMWPFAKACEGLARLVRDLEKSTGKDVDLSVEGRHVELDRSILEELRDPLLHLVRNAMDHGLEPLAARRAAGKAPRGRLTVGAALHGARVHVHVEDDGCGLDLAAIRKQAERRGLSFRDGQELAHAIFLPGFSTSPVPTELSGRGVGLDVVKTRIEALGGSIALSSVSGLGTRFVLDIPLTLATRRAVLVKAGGQTYALPSASAERMLRVGPENLRSVEGREVLVAAETPMPVTTLTEALGGRVTDLPGGAKLKVVVLQAEGRRAAFVVDEFLAEREIVHKRLGARLRRLRHVSGATLLPDGRVALILSAASLLRTAFGTTPTQSISAAMVGAAPVARKRLLVVDDSVTTRTLEASILEAAGYEVSTAADGAEAWQALQDRGADLVVADVEMPRMDGVALTEAIRASKRFRDLPVVLVTALESDKDKARGMEAGADAYLVKSSFDQRHLLETIGQLL
jgi:two-component system, chemotaxis family, sensor kinase CheA